MTTKCAGLNCRFPEENHSPECIAEHAASAAGGRFVPSALAVDAGACIPQTFAGFAAIYVNETGYPPSEQEAFDAGVRAGMARASLSSASGQWIHCSPSLLNAGVSCAKTPRRACACTPENGGHDHWVAHGQAASGQKRENDK